MITLTTEQADKVIKLLEAIEREWDRFDRGYGPRRNVCLDDVEDATNIMIRARYYKELS